MVENESVKLWIQNGILYSCYKEATYMTLEKTIEAIELRHKISNNEYQYWCMDVCNLRYFSKEAMEYIDLHGQELLYACAAIVNSFLTKFMFEVYIRFNKTKVPMKSFTSEEKAVIWLNKMKKHNTTQQSQNIK